MCEQRPLTIRRAELADAAAIAEIYNEAILTTTATFDLEPKSVDDRAAWLQSRDERFAVLVGSVEERVVGFAALNRWSERRAYDCTAESAMYVHSAWRGRGVGRQLKEAIIAEARRQGFHSLIARIAEGSDASIHLNEQSGFVRIGTLKEVGRKFDQLIDVHILQLMLD